MTGTRWLTVCIVAAMLTIGSVVSANTVLAESKPSPPGPIPTFGPGLPVPPISLSATPVPTPVVPKPAPLPLLHTDAISPGSEPVSNNEDGSQGGPGILDSPPESVLIFVLGFFAGGLAIWSAQRIHSRRIAGR